MLEFSLSAKLREKGLTVINNDCTSDDGSGAGITSRGSIVQSNRLKFRQNIRSAVMFVVAGITTPPCAPLIAPSIIAFLAGYPALVSPTQRLRRVFCGLWLVSVVCF